MELEPTVEMALGHEANITRCGLKKTGDQLLELNLRQWPRCETPLILDLMRGDGKEIDLQIGQI